MTALSEHLFWDVDRSGIDPERHIAWLTKRVLEYGRWRDWQILVEHYGKAKLADVVVHLRSLRPKAFAFCCAWFQLPATDIFTVIRSMGWFEDAELDPDPVSLTNLT